MKVLSRPYYIKRIQELFKTYPVVCLIGPRQVGKTTLARQFLEARGQTAHWFDLERPSDAELMHREAEATLEPLRGCVVLDEIQGAPQIFRLLRVLADRPALPARFLVLGSAAPGLLRQSAESLAGRISYLEVGPLGLSEAPLLGEALWIRGGFPRSTLAGDEAASFKWRHDFIRTFLERDLPGLGIGVAAETMRRFWSMLAHWQGQRLNLSELGRNFGVSDTTVRAYTDHLQSTFMLRLLKPWHENLRKRQVKAPKVFVRDSGLAHALLDIPDREALLRHPKCGATWEGFALEQVLAVLRPRDEQVHYWAAQTGAELDLLLVGRQKLGFEFKRASSPDLDASMRTAYQDLKLAKLWVVHPGPNRVRLADGIETLPLSRAPSALEPWNP